MKTVRIYSDESRHKNERFLLLGGIWVEENNVLAVEERISLLREKYGYQDKNGQFISFRGELKWVKVSEKYLSFYKEIVDLFLNA